MRSTFLRRSAPWMLALALLGAGTLPATAGDGDEESRDELITARVEARLADHEATSSFDLAVETVDAVVTLRGEVDSEKIREKAGKLALAARGVREVRNAIKVVAPDEG